MEQLIYTTVKKGFKFLLAVILFSSCKKEDNGTAPAANEKPKVGTVWTYRYYVYNLVGGGIHTSQLLNYKAKSEVVLGGEKWLNIVDLDTDTTVFYLNQKTGGLYQYANNSSNLFCKDPAAINDTYTTFNDKSTEVFTVKGVKDTLATNIGDVPTNYYEGVKLTFLIDQIWYNENAWIVKRIYYLYRVSGGLPTYYKYSGLFIEKIVY